jgi:hypothetical protein
MTDEDPELIHYDWRRMVDLMVLAEKIHGPSQRYWRHVGEALRSASDSPENIRARNRGNQVLTELEDIVRTWVADHPKESP